MKGLYESILKNSNIGSAYYKNYISKQPLCSYEDITFKDFLNYVDDITFVKILKRQFSEANSGKGDAAIYFKDGALGIEIMSIRRGLDTEKWWRQAFIYKDDLVPGKPLTTYYYPKQYGSSANSHAFTSGWNVRLKNIIHDYIDFLKEHYDDLMKKS